MDRKRHIAVVVGLVTLSCLVQVVLVRRATVPGLDAVRFVETAQRIDAQGLLTTIRHGREQPLFPAWVWLVHEGFERIAGELRSSWAASVQLAAAIPLVLAVVPIYFLSVRLVGPAAAVAGCVLFCVLPEVARLGADGISDSTHLLFFSLALGALVVYLTDARRKPGRVQGSGFRAQDNAGAPCPAPPTGRNPLWLLAAGMLTGLAVLARAEALVLLAALVLTLAAFQIRADRRQPWHRLVASAGCLVLGYGLVFGPYLVAVGAITARAAIGRILGQSEPAREQADALRCASAIRAAGADVWRLADDEPMSFAPKDPTTSLRRRGYAAAAVQLAGELAEAFGYLAGALALFGAWRLRRLLVRPVDRFAQTYCLLFSLAVLHFAAKEGYLSARHLLTLVVVGIGCAGYGTLEVGRWMAGFRRAGLRPDAESVRREPADLFPSPLAWTVVLLAAGVGLVEAAKPLHVVRLGHRLAGEWLAREAEAPGLVLDTRGWTGLYSGRTTYRYDDAQAAFAHPQLAYVVLERRELQHQSGRSRTLKHLLDVAAEPVAVFPNADKVEPGQRVVVAYRWNADRFSQWLAGRLRRHPTQEDRHARARLRVYPERI